jgi:excisionase family DNA binding protein
MDKEKQVIPIWCKSNLTVDEAAEYSNIGVNKIREISNDNNCPFVLWVGSKRLIKRKVFDDYIEKQYSI